MNEQQQQFAQRLGFAGLVPFLLLALAGLLDVYGATAIQWFIYYSVAIISFLAGVHWGLQMAQSSAATNRRLGWCMVPPVLAFAALAASAWLSSLAILAWLAVLHLFWLNYERRHLAEHEWYVAMRGQLTFTVVALHIILLIISL